MKHFTPGWEVPCHGSLGVHAWGNTGQSSREQTATTPWPEWGEEHVSPGSTLRWRRGHFCVPRTVPGRSGSSRAAARSPQKHSVPSGSPSLLVPGEPQSSAVQRRRQRVLASPPVCSRQARSAAHPTGGDPCLGLLGPRSGQRQNPAPGGQPRDHGFPPALLTGRVEPDLTGPLP